MIWLLGGGAKSHELSVLFKQLGIPYKLSTIREYPHDMPLSYASKVLFEPPTSETLKDTILKENIKCVIDHTYGEMKRFSKEVISVCEALDVEYIRYELPSILDEIDTSHIRIIDDIQETIESLKATKGNIFIRLNRKVQKQLDALHIEKKFFSANMPHQVIDYEDIHEELDKGNLEEVFKRFNITCIILHEQDKSYIQTCYKSEISMVIIRKSDLKYSKRFCDFRQLKEYLHKYM